MSNLWWSLVLVVSAAWAVEPAPIDAPSTNAIEIAEQQIDRGLLPREDLDALLREAMDDANSGRDEEAIPKLERVIEQRPTALPAWSSLGWAYWRVDRQQEAIRLWKDLLILNPDLPQAYNLLGMAATAEDRLDDATDYYQRSLELDPEQFQTRLSLARIYRWRGYLNESVAILTPLQAENPEATDVRLELARAQLQNWEFEGAEKYWAAIYSSDPDSMENQIALATVYLNNDKVDQAVGLVHKILEKEPQHIEALTLLADAREYGEHPEDAIPTLKRLIDAVTLPADVHAARTRLVRLYVRLNKQDAKQYGLEDAIILARRMVEADPLNPDSRLLLGELCSMDHQFAESQTHFLYVLEHMNANNQRAHRGLFETYLGDRDYDKAWEQYEFIEAFNPNDPYLYYRLARYEAARGQFYKAFAALDELENRGRNGSVAVLLYHAISPSDWTATPSVRRLREQLTALQDAGFRFITVDKIPEYLASAPVIEKKERNPPPLDRVVAVTFDDALQTSMKYGTQVAEELDASFTQFVITGFTERADPFISTWAELQEWAKTGRWSFQSQLYLAEQLMPVDTNLTKSLPLANRLWLVDEKRHETQEEYEARLHYEYSHSQELLLEHLPADGTGVAVAYSLGEIGQETLSNVSNAVPLNLAIAAETFELGFLQSPFGYAVKGDHPFLYQRNELHRSAAGDEMLAQVLENHPVLLAERLRAEFAALQGKIRLANRALRELKKNNYPEESMARTEQYVKDRMARRFAAPTAAETAKKGFFAGGFSKPYLGAGLRYFEDNLDRENFFFDVLGGFNVTPRLTLEARGGAGTLKQETVERTIEGVTSPSRSYSIDETHLTLRGTYVISDRTMLSAEGGLRDFGSPADFNETVYAVEGFFRPWIYLDTYLRYDHDVVESAQSVVDEVTFDRYELHGILHILDWWDVWASVMRYDFSDDNDRDHLTLASQWLLWERVGFYLGLRYGYVNSDERRDDYWTPYKLHRYYIEALLRKNYLRVYYNVGVRAGIGRQSVRAEANAAYAELVERARRQRFDSGEAPSEDWESIYGLFASTRIKLGGHWEANGEIAYSKLPDYNELNINAGLKYRF